MKKTFFRGAIVLSASLFVLMLAACSPSTPSETTPVSNSTKTVEDSNASVESTFIRPDKEAYESGENMSITYSIAGTVTENTWMAIVASTVEHNDPQIAASLNQSNSFAEGNTGVWTTLAPPKADSYDIRLYSSKYEGGEEMISVTFKVVEPAVANEPGITPEKTEYAVGEEIKGTFTAPTTYDSNAWLGLIPSDVPHGTEGPADEKDVDYYTLSGQGSGSFTLAAPTEAGSYDLRMFEGPFPESKEVFSVTLSVK